MSSGTFEAALRQRAERVGLVIPGDLIPALQTYYDLLTRWNATINLVGLSLAGYPDAALDRILIEPLLASRHLGTRVLSMIDIGSGGGSPAIPLALALGVDVLRMVESRSRKAVFLREAARVVGMSSVEVLTARFESLLAEPRLRGAHQLLTVRAVRVDEGAVAQLRGFVATGGQLALFRAAGDSADAQLARRIPLDTERRSELLLLRA